MSVVTTVVADVPAGGVCAVDDLSTAFAGGVDATVLSAFPFV
jgi:hypothetical protein